MSMDAEVIRLRPAGTDAWSKHEAMSDDFNALFIREYPRVVGIAQRVLGDRTEAEDVAQQVFLAFHVKHSASEEFAAAWLHRAASHAALNTLRGNRRRVRREADQAGLSQVSTDGLAETQVDTQLVRQAMKRIPDKSAAILALRYSGLSYAEVADALQIAVNQVGTLLRRAETRLRKEVEQ